VHYKNLYDAFVSSKYSEKAHFQLLAVTCCYINKLCYFFAKMCLTLHRANKYTLSWVCVCVCVCVVMAGLSCGPLLVNVQPHPVPESSQPDWGQVGLLKPATKLTHTHVRVCMRACACLMGYEETSGCTGRVTCVIREYMHNGSARTAGPAPWQHDRYIASLLYIYCIYVSFVFHMRGRSWGDETWLLANLYVFLSLYTCTYNPVLSYLSSLSLPM